MKLYGSYTSPFVRHCRIAFAQSNLAYEMVETDYNMSAEMSPVQKVPFFEDGNLKLTDSSSILKYIREKSDVLFLADIEEFESFSMVNTLIDSTINLFLLEKSGVALDAVPYLARQSSRIQTGLNALNDRIDPEKLMKFDSHIRCACFIDWAIYRDRLTFSGLDKLQQLLSEAQKDKIFVDSAPPQA